MKRILFILSLLVILVCCGNSYADMQTRYDDMIGIINDANIALKDTILKECPFGHQDIIRVSIIVGYMAIDSDLQQKIDNLEIWHAGCISGDEKYKIVCRECRYAYNLYNGYWDKGGSSSDDFEIKLDEHINILVDLFKDELNSISYSQKIKSKTDYTGTVTFFIRKNIGEIKTKMYSYFEQISVKPEEKKYEDLEAVFFEYKLKDRLHKISIEKSVNRYSIVTFDVINKK